MINNTGFLGSRGSHTTKGSPLPVAASAAHTKDYITAYNKIHDNLQV